MGLADRMWLARRSARRWALAACLVVVAVAWLATVAVVVVAMTGWRSQRTK